MVIVPDTSAIAAILVAEPDAHRFAEAIASEPSRLISAVTWVEADIVLEGRKGPPGRERFERFLVLVAPEVVAVSAKPAETALEAFRRFGKGRHRAALNIGDCFAYALALSIDAPLLSKGEDFVHTDLRSALA